jgi:predicted nucleic acid-binding protein
MSTWSCIRATVAIDDDLLLAAKDPTRLLSSGQAMDSYLLALARAHGGKLATFDGRLVTDAVSQGHQSLYLVQ